MIVTKIVCERRGGIYARVEPSEYGPTLVYRPARATTTGFRTSDGTPVGRWALDRKRELGRLREMYLPHRIVLREPRMYAPGERSDPVNERISGLINAWCDHCHIGTDPDFGERLDEHSRRMTVPGTSVAVIWTFSPSERTFEVISPP